MKNKNIKHIVFALECVVLLLLAVMLGHPVSRDRSIESGSGGSQGAA